MTFTTFVNGTLANADEVNTNFRENKWEDDSILGGKLPGAPFGVIAHSTSNITFVRTGQIYNSIDSGVTWVSKNTDLDTQPFIRKCKANSAYAFAVEGNSSTAECAFTSDSSATWTTKAASLVVTTKIYDLSYPTTTLAVIASDDNAGSKKVQFCDPTANPIVWTACTTSPGAAVYSLDMFNGTSGLCVDDAGKIYTTPDSGVTWNYTGHTTSAVAGQSIYAMSATTCLVISDVDVAYYDGTQNAYSIGYNPFGSAAVTSVTKQTDGTYYFFWARASGLGAYGLAFTLGKWGGVGTSVKYYHLTHAPPNDLHCEKCGLGDYGTNGLVLAATTLDFIQKTRT